MARVSNKSADELISEERGKAYGDYHDMAATAQRLKTEIKLHAKMSGTAAEHEAIDLICTKLARIAHGDPTMQHDSWTDIMGYAKLARDSRNETHGNFDISKEKVGGYDERR